MCGRFVLDIPPGVLKAAYRLSEVPDLVPRYNIAPSQPVAAVRLNHADEREMVQLQWGLIPSWAKDPSSGTRLINARCETVHEKPSFRQAFKTRRCIIPASGFYEWTTVKGLKTPYYIHLRGNGISSIAGLWESWKSPEGKVLETCTILTTVANTLVKPLHGRMPVVLHPEELDLWLDRSIEDVARLSELFHPYPADRMILHAVSSAVNSPDHDAPDCIQPA